MRIASISSVSLLCHYREDNGSELPATKSQPAERPAKRDRASLRLCLLLIAVLLDITCIFWVYPIAIQLAEWAGVSLLNAIFVGMAASLASAPVIVVLTVLGWRHLPRR